MNEDSKRKLREWLSQTIPVVSPEKPFDIHFDEILGRGVTRAEMVRACAEAFSYAVEQFKDHGCGLVLILMIPLSNSESMSTTAPSWAEIAAQHHSTPPSIYLVHREALSRPERTERYQRPVSFDWIPIANDRYFACYKTWRLPDAPAEDGWVREVFVEFHSNSEVVEG